jgi:hypothetical protein
MPALPAAVAVMIYRLISAWLVLLVGWVLFLVISARRARRAAAQAAPAAVNLTTSTSTPTPTGLGRWHRGSHPLDFSQFRVRTDAGDRGTGAPLPGRTWLA